MNAKTPIRHCEVSATPRHVSSFEHPAECAFRFVLPELASSEPGRMALIALSQLAARWQQDTQATATALAYGLTPATALADALRAHDQRSKFMNTADKIYATELKRQEKIWEDFSGKATRAGVNPQDVLIDYGASLAAPGLEDVPSATGPDGSLIYFRNGKWGK